MPHTVADLRVMEHVTQAYVLLIDGIPLGFTTDDSGALDGSGVSSFIGRAEDDHGETALDRELRAGLVVPTTLDFGGDVNSLGLDRTTARFSVLLSGAESYFVLGGEEPEEMLGRLPPTTDPAPATVVGVTVRDRYIGLEYIGPAGERREYPAIMGGSLPGFDHMGDTDGATVPASVSTRPLVHEGRVVALYRIYKDPSPLSTSNSDAWPSLSNYDPIWVGKLRDAGTITPGGRVSLECTGFESMLERNMATGASQVFGVVPEFASGDDDQVAIYLGSGGELVVSGVDAGQVRVADTYQGRLWTALTGATRADLRDELDDLISDTVTGTDTDYEAANDAMDTQDNGDAGVNVAGSFFVRKDEPATDRKHLEMVVAMHRRRWLLLGFDPEQQGHPGLSIAADDTFSVPFTKLNSGGTFLPRIGKPSMGVVPGDGYYAAQFHTIAVGGTSSVEDSNSWHNGGSDRPFDPLFFGGETVRVIRPDGDQVLRLLDDPTLLSQSHIPYSGAIDGTDCDAAGYFIIKGKIRRGEGSTDDASLIVEDEAEQLVVARCSWIVRDDLFASHGSGTSPAIYVEQLYDPRAFGYPYRPLDRDWATLELQAAQIHSWAIGTAASNPERADQMLSAMLRSTGTSTGPAGGDGVIAQGDNSGSTVGYYGDIFSAEMGLGIPSSLLPTQAEITGIMTDLPAGAGGELARSRISYEGSFSSSDALGALLEPRGVRVGFDGARLSLYRLRDASPEDATANILEDDLYGQIGNPETVWPQQQARALPPIDAWRFAYAGREHDVRAKDPGAPTRRGDNIRTVNGQGLVAPELYGDDPTAEPAGGGWKNEARIFFGETEARFLARRHGMITIPISRPKGQDVYPGTLITLSNPWVFGADGVQSVSSVVGRVLRTSHHTASGHCVADVLVFEGQYRPPPLFAPMLWIEEVVSSTSLTIATSTDFGDNIGSTSGWTQPAWSTGGSGNAVASLWRMLPDGTWSEVGTAPVSAVSATTVTLASSITLPPDLARTMLLTLSSMASQPEWAQEMYSAVGIQGDNTRTRRFV